jgi:TrmH family RNA methyltransferase
VTAGCAPTAPGPHPRHDPAVTDVDIASPSNPRIKTAVRLRERRERDRTGLTLVDGGRELRRALDAGIAVEEAFVHLALVRSEDARAALAGLRDRDAPLVAVSEAAFDKLAYGDRSDGLVAIVRAPSTTLKALRLPANPLVTVLEGVEKPGNVGAVLRSADGAGADAVVIADARTDVFNPNAIRASLGVIFSLPVGADTTPQVRTWIDSQALRLVTARTDADRMPWDVDLTGPVAIVLGSEADGLGARWVGDDVIGVRIPMRGVADSLNVSVAAAVMLYEARRQRG